ncbi:DUF1737 domain-containing protein [Chryseobacterium arthrosphaerae]
MNCLYIASLNINIMQYKIIVGQGTYDLEKQVNDHLVLGWQLHGGILYKEPHFFQAMTKAK